MYSPVLISSPTLTGALHAVILPRGNHVVSPAVEEKVSYIPGVFSCSFCTNSHIWYDPSEGVLHNPERLASQC